MMNMQQHSEYENQSPHVYTDNELSEATSQYPRGDNVTVKQYLPDTVIEEEYSLNGVPVQTFNHFGDDSTMQQELHVIEFETALMALESFKKIQQPCPKKTLNFGVSLTKKNFDYLRP